MVSLVDIGPLTRKVPFRDDHMVVHGISADALFNLLADIPELRLVFAGKYLENEIISRLVTMAGVTLARVVAAGIAPVDADSEVMGTYVKAAMNLSAGESALLLTDILDITFPQGLKSFLDGLSGLVGRDARGWAAGMKSREQSPSASQTDTPRTSPGDTPQDSSQPSAS